MSLKSFATAQATKYLRNKQRDKRNYATYLRMKARDEKRTRSTLPQEDEPMEEDMKNKGLGKYYHRPASKIKDKLRGHLQAQAAVDRSKSANDTKPSSKQIRDFMKSHVARIRKLRGNKV